ncbi:hypothetical protein VMCG_08738 [Cytospora schulzeri]|uniref:Protein kinase domain-containing protein n=1 Tax=Cytospora schulzeri TaxID=448051 RepID=A0A423VQ45_9PEZI|nr:hypothetical protein VMCG_08738 [Valsa malicola]
MDRLTPNTAARARDIRKNSPIRWRQASYHYKFMRLRHGILREPSEAEVLRLLEDTPQAWRKPPVQRPDDAARTAPPLDAFDQAKFEGAKLAGQSHIQYMLKPKEMDLGTVSELLSDEAFTAFDISRLMFFDFAKYGALSSVIVKWRRQSKLKPFPNRALLQLFHCLAKACAEMESPSNGTLPIVHFDLEPSNMLFGDRDNTEHPIMPLLRVADFGLSEEMPADLQDLRQADFIWNLRWRAKSFWYLPEQSSEDWDYIDQHPLPEDIKTYGEVAGRFGPASNIYHVGLTVWSCITGLLPMPTSRPVPFKDNDGTPCYSYGCDVLDDTKYGSVDKEIRQAVARCLIEEPRRRPKAQGLLELCEREIAAAAQRDGDKDPDFQQWCGRNFREPPIPEGLPLFDPGNPSDRQ